MVEFKKSRKRGDSLEAEKEAGRYTSTAWLDRDRKS
jgi:hypothetical protein